MSFKEKIAKVAELKQEVKTLCDKEKSRNDEVIVHQFEVERVTELIQPKQQNLQ